ncbi:MAG: hypothetical protein H0T53_05795 [Herpetosiphonaceae bacterium]|nr:hypothetical protein [Herpetosiphonaceae bacterium]
MGIIAYPPFSAEFRDYDWVQIAGFANWVVWIDPSDPQYLLNVCPEIGQSLSLRVRPRFVAPQQGSFWVLYRPALAELNGWGSFPDMLDDSAMVECDHVGNPDALHPHQVSIHVRDVLRFPDIVTRFAPTSAGSLAVEPFRRHDGYVQSFSSKTFTYIDRNIDSDWGTWVVCQRTGLGYAVILFGAWDPERSHVYVGHRLLSQNETAALGLPPP